MKRREFITTVATTSAIAVSSVANADIIVPGARRPGPKPGPKPGPGPKPAPKPVPPPPAPHRPANSGKFIFLETFYTPNPESRDRLVEKFDRHLIKKRNSIGFTPVGIFTVDLGLMREEADYDAGRFDGAVFVLQACDSLSRLVDFQQQNVKAGNFFNQHDDLDFVDEDLVVVHSLDSQPGLDLRNHNPERLFQLRIYNSPTYERNAAKALMFERGELALFKRCGMFPVFMGKALCGSRVPNVTYMLSFKDDEERRVAWDRFIKHEEWRKMSGNPQYSRTATRIQNLFLRPSHFSQI